ncbi:putative DsbA family dithiol-disulfide isomerase [Paenibacillus forsythiae]|uniref:DsbA family dithiol-disulfide isomerase n=2 Tax=Paenibacillus forsythiae TaxID=365616 RepID=A0ABU3H575_9BACL|nr:DsbA family oxidoreductase [Paenibacillus forsythiae]MDT3425967.1 putative DsbA family dithiol-disulfide isomerase [Paenibacillus forsythiae]
MKIEIWSDYACPFCYIGKRRLEHALSQFPGRDKVEIEYRSFQLDPEAAPTSKSIHELLALKYGITVEQAKTMNAQVADQALGLGLDFRFDTVVHANTRDSHRLAHYARTKGLAAELTERLMQGYFTDGRNLGDREALAALAAEAGLDKEESAAVLNSDAYEGEVKADIAAAQRLGITGVPFFVFNGKYAISGAQPGPVFSEVLDQVWSEEQEEPALRVIGGTAEASGGDGCADGSCGV